MYRIDVEGGGFYGQPPFEFYLTQEADKFCPKGFARLSEKLIPGASGYGGRSYTIRCAN